LGRFDQVASSGVSCGSCAKVVQGEGAPQLYDFSSPVFIQKTRLTLAFFLSSSNRNRGKAFAVLLKKN
jgi:hypothetical protein